MDVNKEKCKALKKIRKKLADTLGVDLQQRECTYEGKCSDTCPKCKQEEEQLNRAIVAKSALAAGTVAVTVGLTGCTHMFQPLEGDTVISNPTTTVEELTGEEIVGPEEPDTEKATDGLGELEGREEVPDDSEEWEGEIWTTEQDTEQPYELEGDVLPIE